MKNKRNKTAIRFLFFWTLGILMSLVFDLFFEVGPPGTWVTLLVVTAVLFLSGIVYLLWTDRRERQYDINRKLTDPNYE